MTAPRYRPLAFGVTRVALRDGAAGTRYMLADQPLQVYAHRITDRLLHWAQTAPERTWMARRERNPDGSTGDWRPITYAQALERARSIGQALIDRSLGLERPVAILSENDLEHALLALGCIYAGVRYCPVSPAYSTVSTDFEKLRHVLRTTTPGLELKLVPSDGKVEVRYRGPNITPGYWRAPDETAANFDDEGFFCTGDAVAWIDESNPHLGLKFDGRIAEDFKLATGSFVSVGPLRGRIIAAGAPYVQDAVITGLNLNEVGALIFPTAEVRRLSGLPAGASMADVLQSPAVQAHFQALVNQLAQGATGSASRIARLHLMDVPPSIDKGEITDKGSINQHAVLKHRDTLVNALHGGTLAPTLQPHN